MTDLDVSVAARPARDASGSLPIAEYAMLSDCSSAALVGSDGSIDWLCLPRFDSPALFSRLLDPDAGHFSIAPAAPHTVTRAYVPGTLVLQTTFTTDDGVIRLTDALAIREGQRGHDLGKDAPHELLRSVEGIAGTVELRIELAPRPEYGLVHPLFRKTDDGGRTFGGPNPIVVGAGAPVEIDGSTMSGTFTVGEGELVGFAMRWAPPEMADPSATDPGDVRIRIDDVIAAWQSWEAEHDIYEGPNKELVQLSARVLKGLTYRPTGAIIAAATTSLPEDVGGERNWDYRYSWIRDSSLTMEALYIGACSDEATDFASFMTSSAGGGYGVDKSLQIMYGIGGEHDLSERELPHLRGWRDSKPVRAGNGARPLRGRPAPPGRLARLQARSRRQRRVGPDAARRVRRAAERDLAVSRAARRAAPGDPAFRRPARRRGSRQLDPQGRRHVGDARRDAPPPVLEGPVLDRAGSRGQARAAPRLIRQARRVGRRARQGSRGGARTRLEREAPGLRPVVRLRRPRRRTAADAAGGLPAGHRPQDALDDRRDRRRAHRGRSRPSLPQRRRAERRRLDRGGGDLRHLLVLARVMSGPGGRDRSRAGAVRPANRLRQRRGAARRGDRPRRR